MPTRPFSKRKSQKWRCEMVEKAPTPKRDRQRDEDKLDRALDDSFPASDPPSMTAPNSHVGTLEKVEKDKRE